MTSQCCSSGTLWTTDHIPLGDEQVLCDLPVYVVGPESADSGLLYIHDAFGWKLSNARSLADRFSQATGARVYLPDFLHGKALHPDTLRDPQRAAQFDMTAWRQQCGPQTQMPDILRFARHIRRLHTKIGVVGYCWGGSPALQLAARSQEDLVHCVSVAHPSSITTKEVDHLAVPVQIIAPERDHLFPQEIKDYCNAKIPTLGIPYAYEWFPGVAHGFATRGNLDDPDERRAMERACNVVIRWCNHFLT